MITDEVLVVGDKVDLIDYGNNEYRTKVEDITGNGLILVGVPSLAGAPMQLYPDDELPLVFYRESGRYITLMRVEGFETRGEVRYTRLMQMNKPENDQRRESFRLPLSLEVHVCEYLTDMEKHLQVVSDVVMLETVKSKDISLEGISIMSKGEFEIGRKLFLKLFLDVPEDQASPFLVCAEVKRSVQWRNSGKNNIGMHFFGVTKRMDEYLWNYMLTQQQKRYKQKGLLRGY